MERENQYTKYYKNHTSVELKEITKRKEDYHDEARLAAFLELQSREESLSEQELTEIEQLKASLIKIREKEKSEKRDLINSESQSSSQSIIPNLYSPTAILGFTILFSVLFGGVLMFLNLRSLNKKATATNVLLITIGFMLLGGVVAQFSGMNQWLIMLTNVVGGIVLIEFFWKKHIGNITKFNRKSILKPAIISLLISLGIAYFYALVLQGSMPEM
ncbi:APC family permease [Aquimarina agarilytica]|uniref:hypothetical protein n=1 Tax=Aquimarina agarilytica TaxID=1087449 RepID=UPI000287A6A0|nr:hypothetical protein [Aquimarina agarilytica]